MVKENELERKLRKQEYFFSHLPVKSIMEINHVTDIEYLPGLMKFKWLELSIRNQLNCYDRHGAMAICFPSLLLINWYGFADGTDFKLESLFRKDRRKGMISRDEKFDNADGEKISKKNKIDAHALKRIETPEQQLFLKIDQQLKKRYIKSCIRLFPTYRCKIK